jgi:hypothetical protein
MKKIKNSEENKTISLKKKKVQRDLFCHEGEGGGCGLTPSHLLAPYRCVKFENWKKVLFLVKTGFSLPNWFFQQSFVVFDYIYTLHQFKTRLLACPCP